MLRTRGGLSERVVSKQRVAAGGNDPGVVRQKRLAPCTRAACCCCYPSSSPSSYSSAADAKGEGEEGASGSGTPVGCLHLALQCLHLRYDLLLHS